MQVTKPTTQRAREDQPLGHVRPYQRATRSSERRPHADGGAHARSTRSTGRPRTGSDRVKPHAEALTTSSLEMWPWMVARRQARARVREQLQTAWRWQAGPFLSPYAGLASAQQEGPRRAGTHSRSGTQFLCVCKHRTCHCNTLALRMCAHEESRSFCIAASNFPRRSCSQAQGLHQVAFSTFDPSSLIA